MGSCKNFSTHNPSPAWAGPQAHDPCTETGGTTPMSVLARQHMGTAYHAAACPKTALAPNIYRPSIQTL